LDRRRGERFHLVTVETGSASWEHDPGEVSRAGQAVDGAGLDAEDLGGRRGIDPVGWCGTHLINSAADYIYTIIMHKSHMVNNDHPAPPPATGTPLMITGIVRSVPS
jgi:hypothetical protein